MDTRNSKVNAHDENEKVSMGAHVDTDTLIVWTETSGIDMALSFQEAEGCATIWLVLANPKYCVYSWLVNEGAYGIRSCITIQGLR